MAPITQRSYWAWTPTGNVSVFVEYEDTTGRINSIRVDNRTTDRTFRVNIYAASDMSTVVFTKDIEPSTDVTQSIPPGQDYFIEDWIASFGLI